MAESGSNLVIARVFFRRSLPFRPRADCETGEVDYWTEIVIQLF
jgi:hypothetical protein